MSMPKIEHCHNIGCSYKRKCGSFSCLGCPLTYTKQELQESIFKDQIIITLRNFIDIVDDEKTKKFIKSKMPV